LSKSETAHRNPPLPDQGVDQDEDEDVPSVNPFKVLRPASAKPRTVAPATKGPSAPTLADQVCSFFRGMHTEAGFVSNAFPNCTSETIKAGSFFLSKNFFVIFETV
jgi:hypothetical protein